MVRTQNLLSPAAIGSAPRGSGTNAIFSLDQARVELVRTQNILSPAARVSVPRGSATNAKFSKSSRTCC